ncbi:hypothetical protein BJY01DRAFT_237209 [Aspergillus pseudoustus]|uniref:Aminoglycoside phosphotransferase domain-containing protein n=1 Tax=Aspergillus pseudoustus TaxID=1810923 RepID=A0ABR4JGC6_9EURO
MRLVAQDAAVGLPVPRVICYGEHPDTPHARLGRVYQELSGKQERDSIQQQLRHHLETLRRYAGGSSSDEAYNAALDRAKKIHGLAHPIVFSHGDLKHQSIMVEGGRITGFLDWELAGWYPDYWDFTSALRSAREEFWWYHFVLQLGGSRYRAELDCECSLTSLTSASYFW